MDRKLLIKVHMYLAAFFVPAVFLVAISGGLYLLGVKGSVEQETIYRGNNVPIDSSSDTLKQDVTPLLTKAGVTAYEFEYVKVKGTTLYTRPTSVDHYVIKLEGDAVEVVRAQPSLQSRMIELHKGHGPLAFKTFQKVFALGLIIIMVSGLWVGLSAARLRRSTLATTAAGLAVFVVVIL